MGLAQPELLPMVLEDLAGPPLPPLAERGWRVFHELHETRTSGMQGVGPITYGEMAAYQEMTGNTLTPLDVACVREADKAFLGFVYERMKQRSDAASDDDAADDDFEEA